MAKYGWIENNQYSVKKNQYKSKEIKDKTIE